VRLKLRRNVVKHEDRRQKKIDTITYKIRIN